MSTSSATGYTSDPDRGPSLRAFCIVMCCVAVFAVCLRFYCRISNPRQARGMAIWWDDWTCLIALPFVLASEACVIAMVSFGFGRHSWNVAAANYTPILKLVFSAEILYDCGLALCRASALLFYTRIFTAKLGPKWFRWGVYAVHAMNTAWWIGLMIGTPLSCRPVAKNWDVTLPGKCSPAIDLWLGSAIPSVVIDLCILILPLPRIWSLQMSVGRKTALLAVFICGYSVVIISLGRVITEAVDKNELDNDFTWGSIDTLFWLAAESPVAMLSICLPAASEFGTRLAVGLSPITSKVRSALSGSSSIFSFGSSTGASEVDIKATPSSRQQAMVGVRNEQPISGSNFYSASAEYAPEDRDHNHGTRTASNN